jgi:hypothetical protein
MKMTSNIKAKRYIKMVLFSIGFLALTSGTWADGEHPHSEHSLAKASQNPVASLIS